MTDDIADLADLLAAFGHVNRLQLALLLADGPRYSSGLAEAAGMSAALTTHHLGILARAGIVSRRAVGRQAEYELVPETAAAAADLLRGWCAEGVPAAGKIPPRPAVRASKADRASAQRDSPGARLRARPAAAR